MKKILVFILILIYTTASSGAVFHVHYCMGKLVSIDLQDKGSSCVSCGMSAQQDDGCCKDEHKHIKVDKNQAAATISFLFTPSSVASNVLWYNLLPENIYSTLAIQFPVSHAPPRNGKVPFYICHCTLLI